MAKVEGIESVAAMLKKLELKLQTAKARSGGKDSVIVGFTANYALPVHENLTNHHPVGQAKFLEEPARTIGTELGDIVQQAVSKGRSILEGLLLAGLRLQREAQLLCPVDTGNLKNSAFTRVE